MVRLALILLLGYLTTGCYYMQAASGQISLMNKREPIDRVLATDELPADTAEKLRSVQAALDFAVAELDLPDNGSYRAYVQLPHDYVVWNVFAAPELSLTPKTWCFPIVGCVSYRGYFSEARAERYADRLRDQGLDVLVRGATAYSTLGKLRDPVLSSMLRGDTTQLVTTLFHELAHQKLYIRDDVEFNESYASAVADLGIERWVEARGGGAELQASRQRIARYRLFTGVALESRERLRRIYASDLSETEKREQKNQEFARLRARYTELAKELGLSRYPVPPASNAELAPISTYNSLIPAFRALFHACEQSFACLHTRVAEMGELPDVKARRAALAIVQQSNFPARP